MTDDRVHPSSKPPAAAAAATNNPSFPATKSQQYGATRPQPQHHHRNRRRRRCCTLSIYLSLLVLLGITATVFYLIFRPHRPSFSFTSLKLSYLNFSSSSSTLITKFDLTLSATNPNSKIVFYYQPSSVSVLAGDVAVAGCTLPAFEQGKRNTTLLRASVGSTGTALGNDAVAEVKGEKGALAVKLKMVTKVQAKTGALRTPRVGITVLCDGGSVTVPADGKKTAAVTTENSECEVNVRFKVWKWNV